MYEIWSFRGSEDSDYGLLDYDTVYLVGGHHCFRKHVAPIFRELH